MVRSRCNLPGSERICHKRAERLHMDRVPGPCPCARIRKVWLVSSIRIELLGSWGSSLRPDPTSGTAPDRKSSDSICGLAASWAWPVTRALHTNMHEEMQQCAAQGPLPEPTGPPEPFMSLRFVPLLTAAPCGSGRVGWRKGGGRRAGANWRRRLGDTAAGKRNALAVAAQSQWSGRRAGGHWRLRLRDTTAGSQS